MPYFLRRTRDGAGDSGPMADIGRYNRDTGKNEWERGEKPRVGWCVRVGSPYGRTFVAQDYWTTTPVTEILEERDDGYVRFKTGNSEYEWGPVGVPLADSYHD